MQANNNLLPPSITERALNHMEKGVEVIEAVKLAFEEELKLIECLWFGDGINKYIRQDVFEILLHSVYNRLRNNK